MISGVQKPTVYDYIENSIQELKKQKQEKL